jgi:Fur family transcriptional regulator, zinc uptake regulator
MNQKKRRDIEAQLKAAEQACSQQGARLTELRQRVLSLILEAEGPSTAYELLDRLKATRKGAVPPTIYRALDFLMGYRLIHKIERLSAFVPCKQADHFHHAVQFLICRQCGAVAEIEDSAITEALERAAKRVGFQPGVATVEIDGTCAACTRPA